MSKIKLEPFQHVLVRNSDKDHWKPNIFLYYDKYNTSSTPPKEATK